MNKRILVVDDDRDLLRGLTIRLQASGYDVIGAGDGVSATSAARREKPDAIILDIGLPGGNGFTVLERLRSLLTAYTPVIILTARAAPVNRERAFDSGAQAFIQKPADNEMLLATLKSILGEPTEYAEGKT
jgi:DNA-binding response OmpR family regulator